MKENRNTIRSMAIQKKWFLVQFLSSFLLIAILATTIYGFVFPKYKKQLLESANLSIQQSTEFLKALFESHRYTATLMASDQKIRNFIYSDIDSVSPDEYFESVLDYDYIVNYYTRMEDIYDLHSLDIYTTKEYFFKNFNKEYYSFNAQAQEIRNRITDRKTNSSYFDTQSDAAHSDLLYFRHVTDPYKYSEYCGALCFTIPYEKVDKIVSLDNIYKNSFSVIVDNNSNILFYSGNTPDKKENILQATEDILASENSSVRKKIGNTTYISTEIPLDDFGLSLVNYISEKDLYASYFNFQFILIATSTLAFILSIICSKKMSDMVIRRLTMLMDSLKHASEGVFVPIATSKFEDDLAVSIHNYNKILHDLEELIETQKKNMDLLRNYELTLLLEQVNPHFLYNTLELINSIAHKNNDAETSSIVQSLANYYRISLNNGQKVTTLENELRHIEYYLFIQNKRFEHDIALIADIPDELLGTSVITFLLQPIVENCIHHGFLPLKDYRDCEIVILAYEEAEYLIIEITDNGCGIPAEKLSTLLNSSNFAINNINNRLKLFYGNDCGLEIESEYESHTTVRLKLKPYA